MDDIPPYAGSKRKWKDRGFKIAPEQKPVWGYSYWNGQHYINISAYSFDQVAPMRGVKALARRKEWARELRAYTEKMAELYK